MNWMLIAQFADLQFHAQQFPQSSRDPKLLHKNYIKRTYESAVNIICASCGCCYHEITEFDNVPPSYEPCLLNVNVPWHFSCGIDILDHNRIYINLKCSKKDSFSVSLSTYYDIFINNVPTRFEATPTRAGVYE